ncbi:MAG: hypothetical protein Q4F12_00105 [Erysipelotrichaceae bacterium]|nr:hypothetical protein [Erysipelotrichaceae bacterium]
MNKIKFFFRNLGNNVKRFFINLYRRSYGMDDINKGLIILYFAISIINIFLKNNIVYYASSIFFIIFIIRYFSSNKVARVEENRAYRKVIKYLKLKWQYRKTHRIYICKNCKQLIRLPKGQGKIESTCPTCGRKEIHRT